MDWPWPCRRELWSRQQREQHGHEGAVLLKEDPGKSTAWCREQHAKGEVGPFAGNMCGCSVPFSSLQHRVLRARSQQQNTWAWGVLRAPGGMVSIPHLWGGELVVPVTDSAFAGFCPLSQAVAEWDAGSPSHGTSTGTCGTEFGHFSHLQTGHCRHEGHTPE